MLSHLHFKLVFGNDGLCVPKAKEEKDYPDSHEVQSQHL